MTNKKQEAKPSKTQHAIFTCLMLVLALILFINLLDSPERIRSERIRFDETNIKIDTLLYFNDTPTTEELVELWTLGLYCTTAEHDRLLTTSKLHGCYFSEGEGNNLVKINGEWIHRYWLVGYDFEDVKFQVIYQGE